MPSLPTTLKNEVLHYYVDVRGVEEKNVDNGEPKDNVDGSLPLVDPTIEPSTTPILGYFWKLLVERVASPILTGTLDHLRLSKSS